MSILFFFFIDGEMTIPIPCDADSSTVKKSLEDLSSIGLVDVSRSEATVVGGYTWTISFVDDLNGTHVGDEEAFVAVSSLTGGSGVLPSITVEELRKGTVKEVQRISISAGGGVSVDPNSSFKLHFEGQTTNDILALPINATTCLGSKTAKQIITVSTEDTSTEGGDDTVSPHTQFELHYEDFKTQPIFANKNSCEDTALVIANALMQLPPLQTVSVVGQSSGLGDEGCIWEVSLLSATGNPDLLQGTCICCYIFYVLP